MTTEHKSRKWSLPALAILAAVIWAYNFFQIANGVGVSPPPTLPATSSGVSAGVSAQPPSRLRYMGEFRDPFRPGAESRQRDPAAIAEPPQASAELETPVEMRLTGIVGGSGILELSDGQTLVVGPNSKVADHRVVLVGRNLVVLSGPRGRLILHLE